MLKTLLKTKNFIKLSQDISSPSHAYLFYGEDVELNIELAKIFVASLFCGKPACGQCDACRRIELDKNPDLLIVDKDNLQVADIEKIIDSVQLKPMIYKYKIVLIANADGINEHAQNKLLKTLEEPNMQVIFVLTCSNVEKLLPTVRSRLKKEFVSPTSLQDIAEELRQNGQNIDRFIHCDITLTQALKYNNLTDDNVLNIVEQSFISLKTSADIPNIVSNIKLKPEQRGEFLSLLLQAVDCAMTGRNGVISGQFLQYLQDNFKPQVLAKMMQLIDEANKRINANVNFNYVLDDLFYQILKEKYLCK